MNKKQKIQKFIKKIETKTSSKVVGFDFIAIGEEDSYFQDYLMHTLPMEDYFRHLNKYFKDNPSLLLTKRNRIPIFLN